MNNNIERTARAGYVSKGIVYALTGILSFSAAFGLGGSGEGKLGVLEFLQKQPFGKVLLAIMGFGLLCYAFWRFFQSIKDPEDIGSDSKAVGKRIGFFISGLVYFGLGGYALYQIFKPSAGSGGGGSKTEIIPAEYLPYFFYAVAIGLSIKAIFQLVKVYKGDFFG